MLVQSKKRRPIIIDEETYEDEDEDGEDFWYYDLDEEAFVKHRPHKRYTESLKVKPASPLSLELEQAEAGHRSSNYQHLCRSMMMNHTPEGCSRNTLWQYLRVGEMMQQ
jgi:hypothetical protein